MDEGDEGDEVAPEGSAAPDEATESAGTEAGADEGDDLGDEDLGEENPGRPPPKGKGVVWGNVKDTEGELIEAPVQVLGTKTTVVTDLEGRYRLELPPGTYSLRISYELHKSVRFDKVVVKAGKVQRLDTQLLSDEEAVDVIEVVVDADRSTVEGTLLARQKATAVGDSVGRAEISKTPAANAAQAAERVPGATIIGNRFVYVRGLGERYTNSLLNGAPLPSPEPDRAAIPLDVFPSLIIDSLSIVKTFTPDVPGDFAGGSVRIQTRELPTKPLLQASVGLGYDDKATFRRRLAQRGSGTDWLGFDDGTRDLPEGLKGKAGLSEAQLEANAQGINSYMSALRQASPPNYSLSAVAGNGWAFPNDQRVGALVTANYGRSFTNINDAIIRSYIPQNGIDYGVQYGADKVSWGSLASVSYWPSANHRLSLLGLHTQLADSTAQIVQGYSEERSGIIADAGLRYVSRALNFGQLRGEHDFPALARARLEWNGALSRADRNEPDTRHAVVQKDASDPTSLFANVTTPESGSHLHAEQYEVSRGAGLDWTQPFSRDPEASKAKFGGIISVKSRRFEQKRFHLEPNGLPFLCGVNYARNCPDTIYTPENIDNQRLLLSEDTRPEDAYRASLNVYGAYAMVDVPLAKDLRAIGGARLEVTDQRLEPYTQFDTGPNPPGVTLKQNNWLPAISLVFSPTKKTKVRVAAARTLARPQLRELAPYAFAQFVGAMPFAGNPNLQITRINNFDTRFEFYPSLREVLAFSFFYKTFKDPIEYVVFPSGRGILKPENSPGATLAGVEFEARKSLGDLAPVLKDFSAIANLTLARSAIRIQRQIEGDLNNQVTSLDRPMVNQAPFVVNFAVDYANEASGFGVRALYNVVGRRIVEVGSNGFPDAYQQPRHVLDLTLSEDFAKHWQVKLNATNLFGSDTRVTYGPENNDEHIARLHNVAQTGGETGFFADSRVFTLSGAFTY